MKYLVYAIWDATPETQRWDIKEYHRDDQLNAGRPWLCATEKDGLTGVVGMLIEADTEQEAKQKMLATIVRYKLNGKEPNVWR